MAGAFQADYFPGSNYGPRTFVVMQPISGVVVKSDQPGVVEAALKDRYGVGFIGAQCEVVPIDDGLEFAVIGKVAVNQFGWLIPWPSGSNVEGMLKAADRTLKPTSFIPYSALKG